MEKPRLCAGCRTQCCDNHPIMMDSEIRRMMEVVGQPAVIAATPKMESPGWNRLSGKCPALTDSGCVMDHDDRPIACQLYPFQFIAMPGGWWRIMLDVSLCPYWRTFGEGYDSALQSFMAYMQREGHVA